MSLQGGVVLPRCQTELARVFGVSSEIAPWLEKKQDAKGRIDISVASHDKGLRNINGLTGKVSF